MQLLKIIFNEERDMAKLKDYCINNKYQIFLLGVIVFITHGSKLFQNTISIDTEIIINETAWQYENWANIGRPSLMVIKALTGMLQYNPYLANTLTLIGLLVFCVYLDTLFTILFQVEEKHKNYLL